ncbi:MAG: 1-acyl-sn-glycerol-3-phosphate acyltransferase, partial [Pseudomonadota bacterium]|nr:1-acyl-sn-glycerol-3-phosphate acyltransferase [Pseudomonadota bacterium]
MKYAIQWLRSAFYEIHVYLMMAVIGIAFFPWALVSPKGARVACMTYARYAIWSLGWMTGVKAEVRGTPPTDEVLIAAKHQSFLDILMIFAAVPSGKFIMK